MQNNIYTGRVNGDMSAVDLLRDEYVKSELVYDVYIYHDNCTDGLVAMAVASQLPIKYHCGFTTIPSNHGDSIDLDLLKDKRVCFLDFSVGKEKMLEILEVAKHVTVIDHHVSVYVELSSISHVGFKYIYNVGASGAQLAWSYLIGTVEPYFIALVGDRDIWTKKYSDSDILHMALQVTDMDLAKMTKFISDIIDFKEEHDDTDVFPETLKLINEGYKYAKYHKHLIGQIAQNAIEATLDDGTVVLQVNCTIAFISDVGSLLASKSPSGVAWLYCDLPGRRLNSLRASAVSQYDVSMYAKSKGGGGHRRAASFNIKLDMKH